MNTSNISLVLVGKSVRDSPKPVFESKGEPAITKFPPLFYLAHFVQCSCFVIFFRTAWLAKQRIFKKKAL